MDLGWEHVSASQARETQEPGSLLVVLGSVCFSPFVCLILSVEKRGLAWGGGSGLHHPPAPVDG